MYDAEANTVAAEKWSAALTVLPGLTFWASRGTQKGDFRRMTFIFAMPFQAFAVASLVAEENRTVPVVTF